MHEYVNTVRYSARRAEELCRLSPVLCNEVRATRVLYATAVTYPVRVPLGKAAGTVRYTHAIIIDQYRTSENHYKQRSYFFGIKEKKQGQVRGRSGAGAGAGAGAGEREKPRTIKPGA